MLGRILGIRIGIANQIVNQTGNGNVVAARAKGNGNVNIGNQIRCYNCRGLGHYARNCIVKPRKRDAAFLQTQLLIAQKEEARIQLQAEEFDFMATAGDLEEIEEVNAHCILMANLQQASTSGTQTGKAPIYDLEGSAECRIRVQNFKIQFLKEAAKFVRDFKSLAKEADKCLAKHKALEYEIECLLKAVDSQDIMSIVQSNSVVDTSNLQTELEHTKESQDTPCVSDTLDPLSQKLEDEIVSLDFQVLNYAKENEHLKTIYKNLFNSIKVTQSQTKLITDSLQEKLHDTIYENATLRAQLFDKVPPKVVEMNDLSNPVTSNFVPITKESNVVKNDNVITPEMFGINPSKTFREDKFVPINQARASVRTNPITVSQPHVIIKKDVNSNSNGLSSTRVDNTAKTRMP
ncbi:retrovirus-related pol polyprotein from transposon TNT 1-94 [Tanacetum coccineum]